MGAGRQELRGAVEMGWGKDGNKSAPTSMSCPSTTYCPVLGLHRTCQVTLIITIDMD